MKQIAAAIEWMDGWMDALPLLLIACLEGYVEVGHENRIGSHCADHPRRHVPRSRRGEVRWGRGRGRGVELTWDGW
jgi:hypothetical protein